VGTHFNAVLKNCWAAVTHSSELAVPTLIAGVPIVAYDKASPAWKVADHSAKNIDNVTIFERRPWLRTLAFAQWNRTEMLGEVSRGGVCIGALPFRV